MGIWRVVGSTRLHNLAARSILVFNSSFGGNKLVGIHDRMGMKFASEFIGAHGNGNLHYEDYNDDLLLSLSSIEKVLWQIYELLTHSINLTINRLKYNVLCWCCRVILQQRRLSVIGRFAGYKVTMGFDLQTDSLAAQPAGLCQPQKMSKTLEVKR
eukprot:525774-Pelagomonas_calceolata.AAC.1